MQVAFNASLLPCPCAASRLQLLFRKLRSYDGETSIPPAFGSSVRPTIPQRSLRARDYSILLYRSRRSSNSLIESLVTGDLWLSLCLRHLLLRAIRGRRGDIAGHNLLRLSALLRYISRASEFLHQNEGSKAQAVMLTTCAVADTAPSCWVAI
jgi:hypothetical protein